MRALTKFVSKLIKSAFNPAVADPHLKTYPSVKKLRLPKVPIPSLEKTLSRYLEYASVISTEAEYGTTKALVGEFRKQAGPQLQKRLEDLAKNSDNWMNEFWLEEMYLNSRLCLPGYSNAAYIFPKRDLSKLQDLIKYAVCLVRGICDFKDLCDTRELTVDRATGKDRAELCMDQYWRVFSSYRQPQHDVDILHTDTHHHNNNNQHFILVIDNQLFVVRTSVEGVRVCLAEVIFQVEEAVEYARKRSKETVFPISLITTPDRNKAAQALDMLMLDSINSTSLNWIRSSSFVVCLDLKVEPPSGNEENRMSHEAIHMLCGHGPSAQGANRWYHKTLQFVIADSGLSGVNIEHTVSEGIVMIRMVEHALSFVDKEINKKIIITDDSRRLRPKPLTWYLPEELKDLVHQVKMDYQKLSNDFDFQVLRYTGYGRNYPKSKKCSPDSYIQVALQLAYYKAHKRLCSTYESASTRRFLKGRVDNIRANTPKALTFVKLMENPQSTKEEKIKAFREAIEMQTQIQLENINGHGIDNHMAALKSLSMQEGVGGAVFQDPLFTQLFRFPLSTSSVPTTLPGTFLFYGPVTNDGYGCAYNPSPDSILFAMSSFHSNSKTDGVKFRDAVQQSFDDLKTLLD